MQQQVRPDLLKQLDHSEGLEPEAVQELCRATDLTLRAAKQMPHAIGHSMAAIVATEWHLWFNLTGIEEKDKAFLPDA